MEIYILNRQTREVSAFEGMDKLRAHLQSSGVKLVAYSITAKDGKDYVGFHYVPMNSTKLKTRTASLDSLPREVRAMRLLLG